MTHRCVDYPPSILDAPLPSNADGTRTGQGGTEPGHLWAMRRGCGTVGVRRCAL